MLEKIVFFILAGHILGFGQRTDTLSMNGWNDAESVKHLLMYAQSNNLSYFSQYHLYDARSKGDIYSSKFKKRTGEDLFIYGLDFYYATGTYYDSEYKATNRKNIISIVKKMWRENKAIPSFSWHLENPYVPTGFNNQMGCRYRTSKKIPDYPKEHRYVIKEILYGSGDRCGYGRFLPEDTSTFVYANPSEWFDARTREVGDIIKELVDDYGHPIPILFRLWHEMDDNWMWWGKKSVSAEDYKKFFILTQKKIMNYAPSAQILWGYGPDSHWNNENEFMSRYPGDEFVDIIGYDDYELANPQMFERELDFARMVSAIAKKHGKIAALFESANKIQVSADNYYATLLYPLLTDPLVHLGLVQIWGSGRFENELQYQDRRDFLNQNFIIKVK